MDTTVNSMLDKVMTIVSAIYTGKKLTIRSDLICSSKYSIENFPVIRCGVEEGEVYVRISMYEKQIIIPIDDTTIFYLYNQVR